MKKIHSSNGDSVPGERKKRRDTKRSQPNKLGTVKSRLTGWAGHAVYNNKHGDGTSF